MNNDINRLDNVFDELGNVHNSETLNENLNDLESNVDKLVALGLRKIEEFKPQNPKTPKTQNPNVFIIIDIID